MELPFDQYQRYRLVRDLVAPLAAARPGLRVLEVGGRTALLRAFLPDARVHLVDVEPSDACGLVLGDGSRLPFQDASFDLVAACDTLEHVPPDRRDAFVHECARVSRGWVVLAGPYAAPEVDAAEELLHAFLRDKLGIEHRYLAEHRALGLPDRARTEALLAQRAERVVGVGYGNLGRWQALLTASMYLDSDAGLRGLARAYYRFYNAQLYASDHEPPVYRHAVVACHPGSPALDLSRALPREATPARALEPFGALLAELVAFDHRRQEHGRETAELRATVADLEADLAGHRGRLGETEELLDAERDERAKLSAWLAEERAVRVELERRHRELCAEHEDLVVALQRTEARAQETARTLRADLEGHARSLADHERLLVERQALADEQLALHRREVEARAAEVELLRESAQRLTAELAQRAAYQVHLEAQLAEVNALATRVDEALRREHQENLELRAELRSRAKSLLRALSPRKIVG